MLPLVKTVMLAVKGASRAHNVHIAASSRHAPRAVGSSALSHRLNRYGLHGHPLLKGPQTTLAGNDFLVKGHYSVSGTKAAQICVVSVLTDNMYFNCNGKIKS